MAPVPTHGGSATTPAAIGRSTGVVKDIQPAPMASPGSTGLTQARSGVFRPPSSSPGSNSKASVSVSPAVPSIQQRAGASPFHFTQSPSSQGSVTLVPPPSPSGNAANNGSSEGIIVIRRDFGFDVAPRSLSSGNVDDTGNDNTGEGVPRIAENVALRVTEEITVRGMTENAPLLGTPQVATPAGSMAPSGLISIPGETITLASESPMASQSPQAATVVHISGITPSAETLASTQGQTTTETKGPPASITANFWTSIDIGGVPTKVLTTTVLVLPSTSARGSSTGGSNQSVKIGAAVGSTLFVLILLTVCIVLRRKKQRRIHAADPPASAAPFLTSSRDRVGPLVIEPYDAHRDDPENHPNRAKMAAIDLSPVTNITSDSTAHTKHEVVSAVLRDPFGDDARVVSEQSDPFADPGLATQGPPRRLETQAPFCDPMHRMMSAIRDA
ncbi:hypothetical protein JB92DRAFT_2838917 [Gautieria morchelliformis]|nr:hypothetical protein JB92DRAFT_2838917 [Gautieria morchelliformis]